MTRVKESSSPKGSDMILGWFEGSRLEILKRWRKNRHPEFQLVDSIAQVLREVIRQSLVLKFKSKLDPSKNSNNLSLWFCGSYYSVQFDRILEGWYWRWFFGRWDASLPCQSGAQLAPVPRPIDGSSSSRRQRSNWKKRESTPKGLLGKGTVFCKETMLRRVPEEVWVSQCFQFFYVFQKLLKTKWLCRL